jgi:hypothetical protein
VVCAPERVPFTAPPKAIGTPINASRLPAGTEVPAELTRNEAVRVAELVITTALGLAVLVSSSHGVKPTVPDIRAAGAFVPHQVFVTLIVPATRAAPRAVGALLLTMRLNPAVSTPSPL